MHWDTDLKYKFIKIIKIKINAEFWKISFQIKDKSK